MHPMLCSWLIFFPVLFIGEPLAGDTVVSQMPPAPAW